MAMIVSVRPVPVIVFMVVAMIERVAVIHDNCLVVAVVHGRKVSGICGPVRVRASALSIRPCAARGGCERL